MRIEGCVIGFDEYMRLVLDDAEEIQSKTKSTKQLGRIMLKGEAVTLLQSVSSLRLPSTGEVEEKSLSEPELVALCTRGGGSPATKEGKKKPTNSCFKKVLQRVAIIRPGDITFELYQPREQGIQVLGFHGVWEGIGIVGES
ncbi:hypothetical protein ACRRTK_003971 [Alexandromys fortis]